MAKKTKKINKKFTAMEKRYFKEETERGGVSLKPTEVPRGFQVVDLDDYLAKQARENANAGYSLMPFPLMESCTQSNLDTCPKHCGKCIADGGFDRLPETIDKRFCGLF